VTTTTVVGASPRKVAQQQKAARRHHPTARTGRTSRVAPPTVAPAVFYLLAVAIGLLVMLGLVMVLSASSVTAIRGGRSGFTFFGSQVVWAVLGAGALVATYRVPLRLVRAGSGALLVLALGLNVLALVPGFGTEVKGARAWLSIGPFGFQPSELLKLALLLHVANLLARRAEEMHDTRRTLFPVLALLGVSGGLLMVQNDLGSAVVLSGIALGLLFIAGAPLVPLTLSVGALGILGAAFVTSTPYRRSRWLAFLDLAAHKGDSGYQVWQSLIGIASGGVPGVGLGESRAKWGYLPESHTDFIFAIVAEELGLVGATAVLGLYAVVLCCGVMVALRCKDRFLQLVAAGITTWIALQALINIGGVIGVLPLTGLTLPYMSYGRSSLLVMLMAAGFLLRVARRPA
jgi:cell division protein FtsW